MWPPDDALLSLCDRLPGDAAATEEFAVAVIEPLQADLARQFRHTHRDDIGTAADWAVAWFVRNSSSFDPGKGPLPAFLRLIARRDLVNALNRDRRKNLGRIPWAAVEHDLPARNEPEDAFTLADFPAVRAVIEELTDEERLVLELYLDGERATAVFAVAMKVTDLPAGVQAAVVKREKDRLIARLKRALARSTGGGRE